MAYINNAALRTAQNNTCFNICDTKSSARQKFDVSETNCMRNCFRKIDQLDKVINYTLKGSMAEKLQ